MKTLLKNLKERERGRHYEIYAMKFFKENFVKEFIRESGTVIAIRNLFSKIP